MWELLGGLLVGLGLGVVMGAWFIVKTVVEPTLEDLEIEIMAMDNMERQPPRRRSADEQRIIKATVGVWRAGLERLRDRLHHRIPRVL